LEPKFPPALAAKDPKTQTVGREVAELQSGRGNKRPGSLTKRRRWRRRSSKLGAISYNATHGLRKEEKLRCHKKCEKGQGRGSKKNKKLRARGALGKKENMLSNHAVCALRGVRTTPHEESDTEASGETSNLNRSEKTKI